MANQSPDIVHVGITGAEGHIGTTLREGLSENYLTKAFTLTEQSFPSTVADLAERNQVEGIFDGLDAVIHLAADPSPFSAWDSVMRNNIEATYNVYEEARRAGVKRIVFATTNHTQHGDTMKDSPEVLDDSLHLVLRLSDAPNPTSLYGVSKLLGENLGRYFSRHHGVQFVGLRIGATGSSDTPFVEEGSPSANYVRAMYISKRDLVQAFTRALEVETDFLIAYAISNNGRRIFDMRETQEKLGFFPVDDAEDFFRKKE